MDKYIYRGMNKATRTFEIGECDNPRTHAEWCDRRICNGFWGKEDQAKLTVDAMNLYEFILNPGLGIKSDEYGDFFIATVWDSDISEYGETPIKAANNAINAWRKLVEDKP